MPYPTYDTVSAFTPMQQYALEQFVSYLLGWLSAEHKENGSHSAITADSLTTALATIAALTSPAITATTVDVSSRLTNTGATLLTPTSGTVTPLTARVPIGASAYPLVITSDGIAAQYLRYIAGVARELMTLAPLTGGGAAWSASNLAATGGAFRWIDASGAIIFETDNAGFYERARSVAVGAWAAVAFAAGNFTSDTGTWTLTSGDQVMFRYTLVGKTMTVAFVLDTTSVSGGQAQLRITIPGGFTAAQNAYQGGLLYNDNGAGWLSTGNIFVNAGGTFIGMQAGALGVGTWAAAVNTTAVRGTFSFEVQ